jgi:hypothetical protein
VRVLAVLALVAAAVATAAALRPAPDPDPVSPPRRADATPTPTPPPRATPAERPVRRARCPADLAGCRVATGRVIYVEAVDPDGDGDAHYVLAGGDITAPGLSVIDVERALRPRRLPRVGDQVSAAGPVYTGSFGQRQIQAVVVHQRRAPTPR